MFKKRILPILAVLAVILVASAAIYWDAIVMYIAPQIPLKEALDAVFTGLHQRWQESPVPILLRGYDADGLNTSQLELTDPATGAVQGRLEVQSDLEGNQIAFQGTLPNAEKLGSASVYMNREFAALTSDALLQGGYYGITYDSFSQDIRSFPLVSLLAPEKLLNQWQEQMDDMQEQMCWELSLPELPEITLEELKTVSLGLWVLRGRVSTQTLDAGGEALTCWLVTYDLTGELAGFLWKAAANAPMPEDGRIRLSFCLYQKSLIRVELEAAAGEQKMAVHLELGPDAYQDDLSLTVAKENTSHTMALNTQQGRDNITVDGTTYAYQWDRPTGGLLLLLPDKDPLALKLTAAGDGFRVESDQLWRFVRKNALTNYGCTLTVTKGAEIQPPEYKNLDQWSMEDLMIFLNSVWTLIAPQNG